MKAVLINIICVSESGHLGEPMCPGMEAWAGNQSVPEEVEVLCSEGPRMWTLEPGFQGGLILTF